MTAIMIMTYHNVEHAQAAAAAKIGGNLFDAFGG
jgi:hypothetical protein